MMICNLSSFPLVEVWKFDGQTNGHMKLWLWSQCLSWPRIQLTSNKFFFLIFF